MPTPKPTALIHP